MRHPKWEQRLHALLAGKASLEHAYGQWDCMLLAAAAIAAVTGIDHGKRHCGKYNSPASAVRHLAKLGFDSPEAMLDSLLAEKPTGFAQRGDLVLVPGNAGGWPIPALCIGAVALCIGDRAGLAPVPREAWLKAWSVE